MLGNIKLSEVLYGDVCIQSNNLIDLMVDFCLCGYNQMRVGIINNIVEINPYIK